MQGKGRELLSKVFYLLRGVFAITIERLVEIGDSACLAKRFYEEWVVGPSGSGVFPKADFFTSRKSLRYIADQIEGWESRR